MLRCNYQKKSPMKTTLYIARHGETQWNKIQRFQGQLDSSLTELGKEQSAQIARSVLSNSIDVIFSSTLGRAVQSANICKEILNIETITHSKLTERHLGEWQGEKIANLSQDINYTELLHEYTELAPKGGESAIKCGQRINNALKNIVENYKFNSILVIFHGEALRCLLALLGSNSNRNAYDLFKNGSVTTLTYDHNTENFSLS